ncbi:LysM peptidoglycan-binding domain-containing protein [Flavobacterium sp. MAH-1]|uniref:LysM peptidoglycan-binding domain-containing protein n=1 Tax=Flavobacterium agri TaxID=2743471 RepID=A0A7Y8Y2N7_9FLAO|nr:LysM peptidoglycan-binding domain-containing protein [Flavobacterium agri]NUY80090.1 LysM peptidoglycan-binding domain-containing protein [Flavobacterium agri]NYA70115.1 LysM peptidoglycan-binding domain-containing protein [Flavobacterium agri]
MNLRNATLSLLLLLSASTFAQESAQLETAVKPEIKLSYLDSIKATFVYDNMAACVDSLWMKELTNPELFNDLSADIRNIDLDQKVDYSEGWSTELFKKRLAEMDTKSPFNIEYNPGLENLTKNFLKNRKRAYERLMAISEYYFPMFEEALAKYNVPLEIKYLAIVESALNPKAVSRVGATGLWQFMYQTGKQYNLKIDSYVDERSDVLKASEAAAQYMANMYRIFGDWDLVLASYNSGPGNVAKAIRRSGGKQNYWNIRKHLPQETAGYVPAFLATMYIYEYHKEHGIVPNRALVKHFQTDTVMVRKQLTFKQLSDLLDIPVSQLQLLNPSYKLNTIPAYFDKAHYLRLPNDKMAIFTSNEEKIYAYAEHEGSRRERPYSVIQSALARKDSTKQATDAEDGYVSKTRVRYHKVRKGDSLGEISDKYGVSIASIKKSNGLRKNVVPLGRTLKIVTTESVAVNSKKSKPEPKEETAIASNDKKEETTPATSTTVTANENPQFYVVEKGDNIAGIARKFNVSVDDLKKWNNLSDNTVRLNSKLKISDIINGNEDAAKSEEPKFKNVEYVVVRGDNLSTIAKRNNVSMDDLKEWNNLSDNNVMIGTKLIVAKTEIANDIASVEKPSKKDRLASSSKKLDEHYYVKKGDSLFSIAKKYPGVSVSDIKKWNGISGNNLKPGMKLKISG